MLQIYTVAFFGHRYINSKHNIEKLLEKCIRKTINENMYVDFLVGRHGDFDQFASSAVHRIRKNYRDDNSSLVLVLPYPTAEYLNNKKQFEDYYSEIEISNTAANAHPKSAIQIRNYEMVDRSDLIICYVVNKSGGAYKTIKYAMKRGKNIINLANDIKE